MPMYNLIEYSDIYSDTSGSLWLFKKETKRQHVYITIDNSTLLSVNQVLQGLQKQMV